MFVKAKKIIVTMLATSFAMPVFAAFPDKALTVVVPYPAGGPADTIARVFAKSLSEKVAQPVVIENKSGASGTIGAYEVVKAKPDGYTLLFTVTTQLSNQGFNVKPNYDSLNDFEPIVGVTIAPLILAVRKDLGVSSLKELEERKTDKHYAYGSYGAGTSTHVLPYLLGKQMGLETTHIPYRGETPMVTDLMGGRIDMGLFSANNAIELSQAGKITLVGVVGDRRAAFLPDVPTLSEQGYKDMDWGYGTALYASAKVPDDIRKYLHEKSNEAMQDPVFRESLTNQRHEIWDGSTPESLKTRLVSDTTKWKAIQEKLGHIGE